MNQPNQSSKINLRDKGIKVNTGKLTKGCVKNASTKLCIGSIPSNYESIIYRSQTKRAFGRSEKHWIQNFENSTEVNRKHAYSLMSQRSEPTVKDCKNGFGPFLSKVKREWIRKSKTPGPGQYKINQSGKREKKRKKVMMKREKIVSTKKKDQEVPGPGFYEFEKCNSLKSSKNEFKSLFTSKAKRNTYIPPNLNPGPGSYLSLEKVRFKRKSTQPKPPKSINDNYIRLGLLKKSVYEEPGPGSYNCQTPNFKPVYEKIKFSKNFIAPVNENEKINQKFLSPSPTFYKIDRMYENQCENLINWPCFMSETKRDVFLGQQIQGPNLVPKTQKKPNFHFNIKNHWL